MHQQNVVDIATIQARSYRPKHRNATNNHKNLAAPYALLLATRDGKLTSHTATCPVASR